MRRFFRRHWRPIAATVTVVTAIGIGLSQLPPTVQYPELAGQRHIYADYSLIAPPGNVSYAQATVWKWAARDDADGVRLTRTPGANWPKSYDATLVSTHNPEGTCSPWHSATTNVLGRVNELDQWAAGGANPPVVVANDANGPDGQAIADKVTFGNGASTLTKTIVGGGNIAAGERWGARLYYKFVSGTACDIRAYNGTTEFDTLIVTDILWRIIEVYSSQAAEAKQILLSRNGGTDCVFHFSEGTYNDGDLPFGGSCTDTAGNVAQTCNASYYTMDWSGKESMMPNAMHRGEIVVIAAVPPRTHYPGTERYLVHAGQFAELIEGVAPRFILRNQGGGIEHISQGKPIAEATEKRIYRAAWGLTTTEGLISTNPRKHAAMAINGEYAPPILTARNSDAASDPATPPNEADLDSETIALGCDRSGAHCANACIERWYFTPRASQDMPDDAADFFVLGAGPSYLENAAIPRLTCPTGVASSDCWVWNIGDFGTSNTGVTDRIVDESQGVALVEVNNPTMEVFSGLLARGQGRRGVYFDGIGDYVQGANNGVADPGSSDEITLMYTGRVGPRASGPGSGGIGSSRKNGKGCGSFLWWNSATDTVRFYCNINDGVNRRQCYIADIYDAPRVASVAPGETHKYACINQRVAGTWQDPIGYTDGQAVTWDVCAGVSPTGDLSNGNPFSIGAAGDELTDEMVGTVYEVALATKAYSAAEIAAFYAQATQQGTYWSDSNFIAHYKLNEQSVTNGVGLRDHSGNGNHLTVVNGTPQAAYEDAPWPLGSGVVKRTAGTDIAAQYWSGSTIAPDANESFSLLAWVRSTGSTNTKDVVEKQGADPIYRMRITAADQLECHFSDSVPNTTIYTSAGANLSDELWHLVACKLVFSAVNYTAYGSIDGAAFAAAGASIGGTITGNAGAIRVGELANAADSLQVVGPLIVKGYALTDADISAASGYYKFGASPHPNLTYARTSTSTKGICYESKDRPYDGRAVTCYPDGAVPYEYNSDHCFLQGNDRMCLGLPRSDALTNLVEMSERLDQAPWVLTRATITKDAKLAPDGTLTADVLVEDNTAASTHHVKQTINTAAALHTQSVYLAKGDRFGVRLQGNTSAHRADIDLSDCTVGTAVGAPVVSCTSIGISGAWCRCDMIDNWGAGAKVLHINLLEADNDKTFDGDPATYPVGAYIWGAQLAQTSTWHGVYCPTPTAATQTCGAPTALNVSAATLAGWDRTTGVISVVSWPRAASAYGIDLHNGANLNGAVRILLPDVEAYVYNDAAVLQQRHSRANAQVDTLTGTTWTWDSTGTISGTRRAYGKVYSTTYAGPYNVFTTDTGINWTAATGTDLHLGSDNAQANGMDGAILNVSVWSR